MFVFLLFIFAVTKIKCFIFFIFYFYFGGVFICNYMLKPDIFYMKYRGSFCQDGKKSKK